MERAPGCHRYSSLIIMKTNVKAFVGNAVIERRPLGPPPPPRMKCEVSPGDAAHPTPPPPEKFWVPLSAGGRAGGQLVFGSPRGEGRVSARALTSDGGGEACGFDPGRKWHSVLCER